MQESETPTPEPGHPRRRARPSGVAATVEALPPRVLLSVTPAIAAHLEGAGFERMAWRGRDLYVEPGEWIVSLRGMRGPAARQVGEASARLRRLGGGIEVVRQLGTDGLFSVTAPRGTGGEALRSALRKVRHFEFVEPNAAVWALGAFDERDDPLYSTQYALNNGGTTGGITDADIDAPEAWAKMNGAAAGVVVGVIDTGVDYNHTDLAGAMWVNPFEVAADGIDNDGNGFIDDVHGADFARNDGDPMDDHGHGTHVAGIIAATGNNGLGVSGVAPNARIMALRFLDAAGLGSTDDAVAALGYAAAMKARGVNVRLTNNSWGGAEYSAALDRAIRDGGDAGMLFVAAAGNGGADQLGDDNDLTPFHPASSDAPNVVSVAASDNRDALGRLSNYGAAGVDLAAPGMLVMSTLPNNNYGFISGTSMAAPHVSAVAAMAFGMHGDATWQLVHAALLGGADRVTAMAGKTVSGGRLNALGTLRALDPSAVVGRHVFYNHSAFDGRNPAAGGADDAAVAPDKVALLPGQPARFAHYTSYSRGINGVMVDLRNPAGEVGATDFAFAVRTPSGQWVEAPAPSAVSFRGGAGAGASDRVTLTWDDGAVRDTWLRVTVLAGGATGLSEPDVFYFGNAVGETGNSAADAAVTGADFSATRAAQRPGAVPIDSRYDFNRDGAVNAIDLSIVRGHQSSPGLPLFTAPSAAPEAPEPEPATVAVFSATAITPERRVARRIGAYLETE